MLKNLFIVENYNFMGGGSEFELLSSMQN